MNGLRYLLIVSVLLTVPCFAVNKKAKKAAPMPEKEVIEEVQGTIEMPAPTVSFNHKELCALEQPFLVPGDVVTTVEESCPPACFTICKTVRARQNFKIEGGCKKECVKCTPYGECTIVPESECCCKPVCKERCSAKPCCPRRTHCRSRRCCR